MISKKESIKISTTAFGQFDSATIESIVDRKIRDNKVKFHTQGISIEIMRSDIFTQDMKDDGVVAGEFKRDTVSDYRNIAMSEGWSDAQVIFYTRHFNAITHPLAPLIQVILYY